MECLQYFRVTQSYNITGKHIGSMVYLEKRITGRIGFRCMGKRL